MARENNEVKGRACDRAQRPTCSTAFLLIAALLLVASPAFTPFLMGYGADATPTATPAAWKTYTSDGLGIAFRYPPSWYVYADTMQGRYSGLNPILLASFEVQFEEAGHGIAIPAGGAALLVAFEGSDRAPGQSLAEYAAGYLVSPYYHLTGSELMLGQNATVEMEGETGQLHVLGRGANVYSAFTFAGNDPRLATVIHHVLCSLSPLQDSPVPVPRGVRALRGLEGEPLPLSEGPPRMAHAWGGPAMKMPWDRSASYRYTGGPHNWTMDWTCYLAPVADACGLDFGLAYKEVLAAAGGSVQWGDAGGATGKYAIVDHGGGWSTRYLHLSEIHPSLSWGEAVSQGRVLGISGTAGTGPHLHFELRYGGSVPATWHGTAVDGYVPRMFVEVADESKGWNYQGTLTRGSESKVVVTYCGAPTAKWTGSEATIVAGDGQLVASTNRRHTGDAPPTPTPTSTPTPTATPVPAPDVDIGKAVVGDDFGAGKPITFTLAIANIGDRVASGVVVTDIVPPEVCTRGFRSSLSVTPTGVLSYVWHVEPLEIGRGGMITITGSISPALGSDLTMVNRATIWDPQDRTPANNSDLVLVGGSGVYLPLNLRSHRTGNPTPVPTSTREPTPTSTPTATPSSCTDAVANGGFEQDGDWEIPFTRYPADYSTAIAHGGNRSMRLGLVEPGPHLESYSSARQLVTIPADASSAALRFWLYPLSEEPLTQLAFRHPYPVSGVKKAASSGDLQLVCVLDEGDRLIATLLRQRSDDRQWTLYERDLITYAGQTIKLYFAAYNDGLDGVTGMYVDDVSLELCSMASPPR